MKSVYKSQSDRPDSRSRFAVLAISVLIWGCSHDAGTDPGPPVSAPKPPPITLSFPPSADPTDLKPGTTQDVLCTVAVASGRFEPMIVSFALSNAEQSDLVLNSTTIREKTSRDGSYQFKLPLKMPEKAGKYVLNAKVAGLDPDLPAMDPATGKPSGKTGARVEFEAPPLKLEVKP